MTDDGEHAISYQALRRGAPVLDVHGIEVGTVKKVHHIEREHLLDGIDIDTPDGPRFVDAPEVSRITNRAVTLTIDQTDVAALPQPRSVVADRVKMSTTVRRARRFGDALRDRWDRR